MAKNYVEYQRSGISEAKFMADIRFALKKHPTLSSWADAITSDLGTQSPITDLRNAQSITGDGEEVLRDGEGYYYSRFVPSEIGRAKGMTGYTFNYEFTYDDEKTGYGYLYIAEF